MAEVRWTKQAVDDLDAIVTFYRARGTLVEILTIYHSARLLDLRRIAENN